MDFAEAALHITESLHITGGIGIMGTGFAAGPGGGAPRHGHITGAPGVTPIMVMRTMRVTPIIIGRHTMLFSGVR